MEAHKHLGNIIPHESMMKIPSPLCVFVALNDVVNVDVGLCWTQMYACAPPTRRWLLGDVGSLADDEFSHPKRVKDLGGKMSSGNCGAWLKVI